MNENDKHKELFYNVNGKVVNCFSNVDSVVKNNFSEKAIGIRKLEIKDAVEKLFSVKVLKVNTLRYDGKMKRVGAHLGKTKAWKKAIVQIDTNPSEEKYMAKGGKFVSTNKKYKTEIEEISSAFAK